jgi:hypothetical protein
VKLAASLFVTRIVRSCLPVIDTVGSAGAAEQGKTPSSQALIHTVPFQVSTHLVVLLKIVKPCAFGNITGESSEIQSIALVGSQLRQPHPSITAADEFKNRKRFGIFCIANRYLRP